MNFFKKFISGITGYLVLYGEVTREIGGITADFFKTLERQALVREFQASYANLPPELRTPAVHAAFDSSASRLSNNAKRLG